MSIILGLHVGRYILFGTDTRSVMYDEALQTLKHAQDGHQKLKAGPMGLMTGSGAVDLLDGVIARFPSAMSVQALLDIIADEQAAFSARLRPEHRDHPFGRTGFMVTYHTAGGPMRFAWYHPDEGHGFYAVEPGSGVSFVPECPGEAELRGDVQVEMNARLQEGIRVCEPDEPMRASIRYHTTLLRSALAEAHRRIPDTTSPDCLIGVHTETGQVMVTDHPLLEVAPQVSAAA